MTINYKPSLDIRNVASLPQGLNCKYLLCINGLNGEFVAKSWHRKFPKNIGKNETIITFK